MIPATVSTGRAQCCVPLIYLSATIHKLYLTMNKRTFLAATLLTLLHFGVQAQPVVRDGALTDAAGRTVYTFDKDAPNKSNCVESCLLAWPAFVAKLDATAIGAFGLINTAGAKQWTVNGKPLYYFAGDFKLGDRQGDGRGGIWHIVSPTAPK